MVWSALYLMTIVAANWAIGRFGIVPVGFGLLAPAGVYFAGLAFTFRDLAHERIGHWAVMALIVAGAAISLLVAPPQFGLASGAAFLFSEFCDLFVYAPLRSRNWLAAVAASNIVGLVVDSMIFLWLAFGSWSFLAGQIVGKAWMTALAVAMLLLVRRRSFLWVTP